MKRLATLIAIVAFVFLVTFVPVAFTEPESEESELEKFITENRLIVPREIADILNKNNLVSAYGQKFNDTTNADGENKERYFLILYTDKDLAEKCWKQRDLFLINKENIKAKICFDLKKKMIRFCWYDEWGRAHSAVYVPL